MTKTFENITNENQMVDTLPEVITYNNKRFSALTKLGYDNDKKTALTHMLCFAYGLKKTQESWKDVPDRELVVVGFTNRYNESVYGIYQNVIPGSVSCKIKILNKITENLMRPDFSDFFNGMLFDEVIKDIFKN
jgi:hypothetical protein